jgi:MerR, DNA binding
VVPDVLDGVPPPNLGHRSVDGGRNLDPQNATSLAEPSRSKVGDIKDLLAISDTGVCPCEPAEELLRRRLADLDAEMARLSALREQMVAMVGALPSQHCPPSVPDSWCPPENDRR